MLLGKLFSILLILPHTSVSSFDPSSSVSTVKFVAGDGVLEYVQ